MRSEQLDRLATSLEAALDRKHEQGWTERDIRAQAEITAAYNQGRRDERAHRERQDAWLRHREKEAAR